MKKLIITTLMIMIFLIGCEQDALNYFQEASVKTDEIVRGKSTLDIQAMIEVSESMKEVEPELAELLNNITYSSENQFDKTSEEHLVRQYLGTNMMGFDTVYYNNKGFEYVKVPFVGKYLKMEDLLELESFDTSIYDEPPVTQETLQTISEAWLDLVEEDDVVNLGNEVVDTPEGEVKVKKLVVTFSNEQVKVFLNKALDMIAVDETFKKKITEYPIYTTDDDGKMTVADVDFDIEPEKIIEYFRALLDDIVIEEFKMVTYVDVDQYIIESEYNIHISFVGDIEEYLKRIKFNSTYQLYDLHEDITFEFPEINEQNTITLNALLDQLDYDIPILE